MSTTRFSHLVVSLLALVVCTSGCSSDSENDDATDSRSAESGSASETGSTSSSSATSEMDTGTATGTGSSTAPDTMTDTSGATESATSTDPDSSSGTAGSCDGCNDLVLPTAINKMHSPDPLPAFTGGTITDGTYVVTSIVIYESNDTPDDYEVQEIYRFTGDQMEVATASSDQAEVHACGTYSTADNLITIDIQCPAQIMGSFEYTATETEYIFQHGDDPNEVAYATKQ